MDQLVQWLQSYSLPTVFALMVLAATIYVLKLSVEKAVAASSDRESKHLELILSRRSAFEAEVLKSRYVRVINMAERLERIMTNLNRLRSGNATPDNFIIRGEILPLTEVFEDLEIYRLELTEPFYAVLKEKAIHALNIAQLAPETSDADWSTAAGRYRELDGHLRGEVETQFGISTIRWETA